MPSSDAAFETVYFSISVFDDFALICAGESGVLLSFLITKFCRAGMEPFTLHFIYTALKCKVVLMVCNVYFNVNN